MAKGDAILHRFELPYSDLSFDEDAVTLGEGSASELSFLALQILAESQCDNIVYNT